MFWVILCVLDSFGIGGVKDVEVFGDVGFDMLGYIVEVCVKGIGDWDGF